MLHTIYQMGKTENKLPEKIQMVDLQRQYHRFKEEIDEALLGTVEQGVFINGPRVSEFARKLADYLDVNYLIPCGNGTDALQIALMALELKQGDEVIVPAFTYVAAAEVIALLGLTPVWADVDPDTFTVTSATIEEAFSSRTRAIVAVHLFGQCCDMAPILSFAAEHSLFVIEDNAQSMGAVYTFPEGFTRMAGTMGVIGTTSFFPSKPLACYGDGGAMFTRNQRIAAALSMIANHGQQTKYHHQRIGCNSRLDTIQAAVLEVKLAHLGEFTSARQEVARRYDEAFQLCQQIKKPVRAAYSTHVYHQYTLQVANGKRDALQQFLKERGVPSMVYYPLPLHQQEAFRSIARHGSSLEVSAHLCRSVLSLPIHTEMKEQEVQYIIQQVLAFFE